MWSRGHLYRVSGQNTKNISCNSCGPRVRYRHQSVLLFCFFTVSTEHQYIPTKTIPGATVWPSVTLLPMTYYPVGDWEGRVDGIAYSVTTTYSTATATAWYGNAFKLVFKLQQAVFAMQGVARHGRKAIWPHPYTLHICTAGRLRCSWDVDNAKNCRFHHN